MIQSYAHAGDDTATQTGDTAHEAQSTLTIYFSFSYYAVKLCILICSKIQVSFSSVTEAKYMRSVLFLFPKLSQYCSCCHVVLTVSLCSSGDILDKRQICNEVPTL